MSLTDKVHRFGCALSRLFLLAATPAETAWCPALWVGDAYRLGLPRQASAVVFRPLRRADCRWRLSFARLTGSSAGARRLSLLFPIDTGAPPREPRSTAKAPRGQCSTACSRNPAQLQLCALRTVSSLCSRNAAPERLLLAPWPSVVLLHLLAIACAVHSSSRPMCFRRVSPITVFIRLTCDWLLPSFFARAAVDVICSCPLVPKT